jgi:hypothetical protein
MPQLFKGCTKRDRDVSGAKHAEAPRIASSPEVADGSNRPLGPFSHRWKRGQDIEKVKVRTALVLW